MLVTTLTWAQTISIPLVSLANGAVVVCSDPDHEGVYYVDPSGNVYQIGTYHP